MDICANCGKEIELSDYARWCNLILQHKPACSYECNVALGQVELKADENKREGEANE